VLSRTVRVAAYANIALAKYWGKADLAQNLPAVPSVSLTLDALRTMTSVRFSPEFAEDRATLDGVELFGRPLERIRQMLDRVRALAGISWGARVSSENGFPTAAGLASSASGFAALALAATRAADLALPLEELSALARVSSVSAARSLMGGFVSLGAKAERAERLAPPDHWDVVMLVLVTSAEPKAVSSTDGMLHTARTSPYYPAWLEHAPRLCEQIRASVLDRELEPLGAAMEQSTLMMHAAMLAARPPLQYISPTTLGVMERVRELRQGGLVGFFSIDAGPQVKVLTTSEQAPKLVRALSTCPGVHRVLVSHPGPDACELGEAL
jgi:diphosphomevalonate decarboxylase